jgi:hypothetical protein
MFDNPKDEGSEKGFYFLPRWFPIHDRRQKALGYYSDKALHLFHYP